MNLSCQSTAINELQNLASRDRHALLIEGVSGSGKTYLAKEYAKMLGVADFAIVKSTVQDIRNCADTSYNLESKVVFCIENLDSGVAGASYTLLKFLEEPRENVYVVVTCCNIHGVPDTIVSRSSVVTVSAPTFSDLDLFSRSYPSERQKILSERPGMRAALRNLLDVDYCMNLTSTSYCDHLDSLVQLVKSNKSVSDIVWSIGHYPDNTEIPVKFAIKYIISNTKDEIVKKHGIRCIYELDSSRVAAHAVLSRFVLDCKYGD